MQVEAARCLRRRSPLSACRHCADVCARRAITLTRNGPAIGPACDDCGICATECRAGALGGPGGAEGEELLAETTGAVACAWAFAGQGALRVACVRALSPVALAEQVARRGELQLRLGDCSKCGQIGGTAPVERHLESVRALLAAVGVGGERLRVEHCPAAPSASPNVRPVDPARRGFLLFWQRSLGEAEGGSRPQSSSRVRGRRTALARLLTRRRPVVGASSAVAASAAVFFRPTAPPSCDGCGVCARLCPEGALVEVRSAGEWTLRVAAEACTGCGLCADVCDRPGFRIEPVGSSGAPGEVHELVHLVERGCPDCGAPTFGREAEPAAACRICLARRQRAAG